MLALLVQITFAQDKVVKGVITDGASGDPLPGANVKVKGTNTGAASDFDGNYVIKANTGDILIFSYVGYETVTRKVGSSSILNVTLKEGNQLNEVVVTALGAKRNKRSLGYAQQTVASDELATTKQSDIVNAMSGKISGIQIMAAPKSGFNRSQIRLRGDTSVLYVVDGIRLHDSDDVNPEDVKNMSVLKGAAATALYGPEGRNGVVIITTTKAKKGDGSIEYNSSVEIGKADYIHELQNEYGGGYKQTFPKFHYDASRDPASWASFDGQDIVQYYADESWGPKLDGRPVRQWYSWVPSNPEFGKQTPWKSNGGSGDFFKTSLNTKQSLTFVKGGEGYNLKFNILRNDRTLNIENSERANTRISFAGDYDVSSKINISSSIGYQDRTTLNNPREGYNSLGSNFFQWWQAQLDISKLRDYRQGGKIVSWNIKGPRSATPKYWDSPYFELYENLKHSSRKAIIGNIALNYDINKLFKAKLTLNKTYDIREFDSRTAWEGLDTPAYRESNYTRDRNLLTGQFLYDQEFDSFNLSSIVGFEIDRYMIESNTAATKNGLTVPGFYSISTSKERPTYTHYVGIEKGRALYGTATIGYKNMLFLDGSLRQDWSSTAKVGDNGVLTKGASLSFIFSELIPENNFFSYGKLRGGIAQGPKFPDRYALSETYRILPSYGSHPVLSVNNAIFNKNLRGGIRQEIELGTELRFFNNRLGIDVTYFDKKDSELPTELSLDPTTGYTSVFVNSGEQTYKGFEVNLSGTPIRSDNFTWKTSFNFATLERRVVKLAEGINQTDLRFLSSRWGGLVLRDKVGERWGDVYGRKVKTINGKKILRNDGSYVTEDDQFLGNYLPDFTGGFINSFKYKNFSLNVDMDYQVGGKYFSITQMFINSSGLGKATVGNNKLGNPIRNAVVDGSGNLIGTDLNGDGTISIQETFGPADTVGSNSGGHYVEGVDSNGNDVAYYVSPKIFWGNQFGNISEFTHDATYLSIRNIRLGYSIPKKLINSVGLNKFDVAVYVNNAFLLFSSIPSVDPSQLEQRYRQINFMEGGQLPGVRTYGLNLKINF